MNENAVEEFIQQLDEYNGELPTQRTLLEVWAKLLANLEEAMNAKVTPDRAVQLLQLGPELQLKDLEKVHREYHSLLIEYRGLLAAVIESDPAALHRVGDDGEANAHHYHNLLLDWQLLALQLETEWDCTADDAAIKLAAIRGSRSFVLGDQGLTAHLDHIGLMFESDIVDIMTDALRDAFGDEA